MDFNDLDAGKVSDWLGITKQQFGILRSIYNLESMQEKTNPSNILKEYNRLYGKELKRQNLFTQIKPMITQRIIDRVDKGIYVINTGVVRQILEKKEGVVVNEAKAFRNFMVDMKKNLDGIMYRPSSPVIEYLNPEKYFATIAQSLRAARRAYTDSAFPVITYSFQYAKDAGRLEFVDVECNRCLKEGELEIKHLSNLNIEFPFYRAMRIYNNAERAYNESKIMIDQIETLISESGNFDIRYIDPLPGPHGCIIEYNLGTPTDVFIAFRGSNVYHQVKDPYGGLAIKSPEIAKHVQKDFMSIFKIAEPVRGKRGEILLSEVRDRLDKVYRESKKLQK